MEAILNKYADKIENYEITENLTSENRTLFEARIYFKNKTSLAVFDHIRLKIRKYSYHWMDNHNTLIIRWDNSPHHKDLENYPHHKHIGETSEISSSEEMDLEKVFKNIFKIGFLVFIIISIFYFI